jgi:hypothetical protein
LAMVAAMEQHATAVSCCEHARLRCASIFA